MKYTEEHRYFIKDVAEMTGLSEQLIRRWENRYQIVVPARLANGYRVYTADDIVMLRKLKAFRDEGKSMKKAIQAVLTKHAIGWKEKLIRVEKSSYVNKLIKKGTVWDEAGLMLLLEQANHQYGLDLFLQNTVQYFLEEIGELWAKSIWSESQETIASLVVRDFLTKIARNITDNMSAPHVIGFCLPNERHEIPLQIVLLQMKLREWRTTRVGASPKFSTIEELIEHMQPEMVLFSASTLTPFQCDEQLMEKLDKLAQKYDHVSFHIGGRGVFSYTKLIKPKHMHVSFTIEDVLQEPYSRIKR